MRALRPFWSRRELFVIIWPMQMLSSVPVFLDNAEPSLRNCVRASLCQPPTEFATMQWARTRSPVGGISLQFCASCCHMQTGEKNPGWLPLERELLACWNPWITVTSRAVSLPAVQRGIKISAGRRSVPGKRARTSCHFQNIHSHIQYRCFKKLTNFWQKKSSPKGSGCLREGGLKSYLDKIHLNSTYLSMGLP